MLNSGPQGATRLLLAHGAGAPVTSPFMDAIADLLAARDVATSRFEFAYMAARRDGAKKRPPPKAEVLITEYAARIATVAASAPECKTLVIGGKSLGGRIASMIADEHFRAGSIAGLVCLGYPFHPPGQPDKLRTAHLETLGCPALIVQGTRDPFGARNEVEGLKLSKNIKFHWAGDGDHDFGPRGNSGFTRKGNLRAAADAVSAFLRSLPHQR